MLIEHIFIICYLNLFLGAFVHACRKNGRHLVGYEADDFINNYILQPLRELSSQKPVLVQSSKSPSLGDDGEPPRKIATKSRLST